MNSIARQLLAIKKFLNFEYCNTVLYKNKITFKI